MYNRVGGRGTETTVKRQQTRIYKKIGKKNGECDQIRIKRVEYRGRAKNGDTGIERGRQHSFGRCGGAGFVSAVL